MDSPFRASGIGMPSSEHLVYVAGLRSWKSRVVCQLSLLDVDLAEVEIGHHDLLDSPPGLGDDLAERIAEVALAEVLAALSYGWPRPTRLMAPTK